MTNTPQGQVPEALIDLIDTYAETRHRCGGIYNAKTEAARKAVIEALSGVQALSAAPAGLSDEAILNRTGCIDYSPGTAEYDLELIRWYRTQIASPTLAEQQAAPNAAPVCVCGEPQAPGTVHRVDGPCYVAAPQQEAQEPVAISEAIERMAADRYKVVPSHESVFHRWAVVAGTGTQQLYLGREVECQNMARKFAGAFLDGAFVAMQQAAPQQEAQEPYAYAVYFPDQPKVELVHDLDELIDDLTNRPHVVTKLYTAPQPAPAELERLRERIGRMGLDVDRAMRGHVNEQSPLGTQRLAAIAALAKPAPAPLSDDAKDAARYRFLAGHCRSTSEHWGGRWSIVVDGPAPKSHDSEDDFDDAVDAAIAAQGAK